MLVLAGAEREVSEGGFTWPVRTRGEMVISRCGQVVTSDQPVRSDGAKRSGGDQWRPAGSDKLVHSDGVTRVVTSWSRPEQVVRAVRIGIGWSGE